MTFFEKVTPTLLATALVEIWTGDMAEHRYPTEMGTGRQNSPGAYGAAYYALYTPKEEILRICMVQELVQG